MHIVDKKLFKAFEELFIETAIAEQQNLNNAPPIDKLINSIQENIENKEIIDNVDSESESTDSSLNIDSDTNNGSSDDSESIDETANDLTSETGETTEDSTDSNKNEDSSETKEDESNKDEETKEDDSEEEQSTEEKEVEKTNSNLENTKSALEALEEISEILEQTLDTGGLNDNSADVIQNTVSAVANGVGVGFETIDNNLFKSISKRRQYSLEAISNVKTSIINLIKKIIEYIGNIIEFSKRTIQLYKSDYVKKHQQITELKNRYRNTAKVIPVDDELEGTFASNILIDKSASNDDVIKVAKRTKDFLDNYIDISKRDIAVSINKITEFRESYIDISVTKEESNKPFNIENLKEFGIIFGVALTQSTNVVEPKVVENIIRPSNTISSFLSDPIAGGFKLYTYTANKNNIVSEDILNSKNTFTSINDEERSLKIDTLDITKFPNMFEILDSFITVSKKSYDLMTFSVSKLEELEKIAKALNSSFNKLVSTTLDKADINTNYESAVPVFVKLINTFKNFYITPIDSVLTYTNRYLKNLIIFTTKSLDQYV